MTTAVMQLLFQGAEARLYATEYEGKECIVKERFVKTYRHPTLDDSITLHRIRNEIRTMQRCRLAGIPAPTPFRVDLATRRIYIERISAITVREYLKARENTVDSGALDSVAAKIGELIAALHRNNIVHGDLTTSNMLLRGAVRDGHGGSATAEEEAVVSEATECGQTATTVVEETQKKWRNKQKELDKLCDECVRTALAEDGSFALRDASNDCEMRLFIVDFGLSSVSQIAEDKAVDLYVLERSFTATHPRCESLLRNLYAAYERKCACVSCTSRKQSGELEVESSSSSKLTCEVLKKLEDVRARGRKRTMVG